MTALKTKFLKYIDSVTNEEHLYEVIPPAPTENDRGGIIASPKTDLDTAEAKLGEDGKLYVNASVQIPADWNQEDTTAQDYIKNKPEILGADDAMELLMEEGLMAMFTLSGDDVAVSHDESIYIL